MPRTEGVRTRLRPPFGGRSRHMLTLGLHGPHIGGLLTLRTLGHLELDGLTLFQGLVALYLDGGEMYEHILTVRLGDEAVALVVVEPLHRALSHCAYFLSC